MNLRDLSKLLVVVSALSLVGIASTAAAQSSGEEEGEEKKEEKVDVRAELNRANSLAARNALTRSIPHYEKVLKAGWDKYPSAHYNLASVLKAKKEWARALLHYQAYLLLGQDPGTIESAEKGVEQVKANVWSKRFATLSIDVEPEREAKILVDGFVVAQNQDIDELTLVAGEYTVRADVVDHHPTEESVTLENEGSKSVKLEPTKKTFHGKARISVDKEGATVKFKPEELDGPKGPDEPIVKTSPIEEPVELVTGKWLVEVTLEGHHKWVRYLKIRRDKTKSMAIQLEEKLPEEIR